MHVVQRLMHNVIHISKLISDLISVCHFRGEFGISSIRVSIHEREQVGNDARVGVAAAKVRVGVKAVRIRIEAVKVRVDSARVRVRLLR